MIEDIKHYWWLILLRGIVTLLFGIFTLVSGLFSKAAAQHRAMPIVQGGLQTVLGLLVLSWPGITAFSLLGAIIAFAFLNGIAEIVMAFQTRSFWLGLSGLAAVLFGVYAFRFPGEGALTILLVLGSYAVIAGVMLIIGSFRVRTLVDHSPLGHMA